MGTWDTPSVSLSGQYQKKTVSILGISGTQQVNILDNPIGLVDFHLFGRMRGLPSRFASVAMLERTDPNLFKFTLSGIKRFKDSVANAEKRAGGEAFKIISDISYDEDAIAKQVASFVGEKKTQEYWIDPARGFVCPRLIFYDNGNAKEEYKADHFFLHLKTGLWFPENYEEIEYNSSNGKVIKRVIYKVDPQTFKLNERISDNEFSIDIPEQYKVVDTRQKKSIDYTADERGELSLAADGLDLDHQLWLRKVGDLPTTSNNRYVTIRIISIVLGLFLILLSLFFKFKKRTKNLLPLFLFSFMCGCNSPTITSDLITVSPSVLDFGKVRATDPPVQTQFTLCNNGTKPVTILEITSGCGCTVVEPPQKNLPAGAEIVVPVKVNVWGRYGNFENTVRIKTDAHTEPIQLAITGNIITDVWISSQSLRCTAASGQSATAVLELHTVDYPDVDFDFAKIGESITVKEISRTSEDGETIIKFNVAVEMGDNDIVTRSLALIPTDTNIAPLTVPIYCYRENEPMTPPVLQTQVIALGTVYAGEQHKVPVYGDSDLIGVIRQAFFSGNPDDVNVQIITSEELNVLHLGFKFPDIDGAKTIDGKIKL